MFSLIEQKSKWRIMIFENNYQPSNSGHFTKIILTSMYSRTNKKGTASRQLVDSI